MSKIKVTQTQGTSAQTAVTSAIKVNAAIVAQINVCATADQAAAVHIATRDRGLVKLGTLIGEKMGKIGYTETREAIKPLLEAAYAKVGKDALYSGQQLSRVMALAYPGGKSNQDDKVLISKARKQLEKGLKAGASTLKLVSLATGKAAYNEKGEIVPIRPHAPRHNEKTPIDTLRAALAAALTAAKTAEIDEDQIAVAFLELAAECEYDIPALADAIATQAEDVPSVDTEEETE